MKQKIKKINLGERMFGYEKITKNQLMPKQPAVIKVNLKNYDKFIQNLSAHYLNEQPTNTLNVDVATSFALTIRKLCEEIGNIVFAFYQKDEVMFLIRDDYKQEQEQYYNGDIQKITSSIASKFTYYFNNFLNNKLKMENKYPAFFTVSTYNLPRFEVVNNFIFKQQESIKQFIGTKYENGICFYKVDLPINFNTGLISEEMVEKLAGLKKETINTHKSKWIIDIKPPIFATEKIFIEQFLNDFSFKL